MRYVIDKTEVPEKFKNLYGTTILSDDVCFVCKNCGSELYWDLSYPYTSSLDGRKSKYEEEENALHRIASEKLLAAHESKVCPICEAKLLREKGYYIPNKHSHKQVPQGDKWYDGYKPSWKYGDTDDHFALLARVRESMEQEQIDSAVATYLQICDSYVAPVTSGKSTEIQQNCESLKTYLLNLIHLENNIYSLKQQLSELYRRRMVNDLLIVHDAHAPGYVINQGLKGVKEEYRRALNAVDDAKAYKPRIVVPYPTKPTEPTLGKPGIFNLRLPQILSICYTLTLLELS